MRAEAREHHRLAGWHRRRARERMAELVEFCRVSGISIESVEATGGRGHEWEHESLERRQ